MTVRYYSSTAQETTLSGTITNSATSITVGSVTGFPATTPYTLALAYETSTEELVQVDSAAGTTLTVVRGVDGTSAAAQNAGARVRHVTSARDFSDSRSHENANEGVHGLAPGEDLVGESSTQTLTNKTLTSPVINTPIISSPTQSGGTYSGTQTVNGTLNAGPGGLLRSDNVTDVSLSSTNHALQIGPTSGSNLRMDANEIISANNGAVGSLFINPDGGNIFSFNNQALDSITSLHTVNGVAVSNIDRAVRSSGAAHVEQSQVTGDSDYRFTRTTDGAMRWGTGTGFGDIGLSRTGAGVLNVDNSLTVTNGITTTNLAVTNSITRQGLQVRGVQTGTESITFPTDGSFTKVITFGTPFINTPIVTTNIASGSGNTARWTSRAITVSTTGFTLFLQNGDAGQTDAWTGIPVQWIATAT